MLLLLAGLDSAIKNADMWIKENRTIILQEGNSAFW